VKKEIEVGKFQMKWKVIYRTETEGWRGRGVDVSEAGIFCVPRGHTVSGSKYRPVINSGPRQRNYVDG
jgi:hypothetical protein